jgi:hypothetical protein
MLTSRYDLYIGIGIGAVSVIIIIIVATIIFCNCCVPSSSHRYFRPSVSHYAAINNIDAKTYFKPPQHLVSNFFLLIICLFIESWRVQFPLRIGSSQGSAHAYTI